MRTMGTASDGARADLRELLKKCTRRSKGGIIAITDRQYLEKGFLNELYRIAYPQRHDDYTARALVAILKDLLHDDKEMVDADQ